MGTASAEHPLITRRQSPSATGQVHYSPLWQPARVDRTRVYPHVRARGRGAPTSEEAGERMRRLATTHPRKRRRRYEMTVLLQRQVCGAGSVVRIKPAKRIFSSATPFHF